LRLRQNLLNHLVGAIAKTIDDVENGIAAIMFQHSDTRAVNQRVDALPREKIGIVERGEFRRLVQLARHAHPIAVVKLGGTRRPDEHTAFDRGAKIDRAE
jgi:hypothetical protein